MLPFLTLFLFALVGNEDDDGEHEERSDGMTRNDLGLVSKPNRSTIQNNSPHLGLDTQPHNYKPQHRMPPQHTIFTVLLFTASGCCAR